MFRVEHGETTIQLATLPSGAHSHLATRVDAPTSTLCSERDSTGFARRMTYGSEGLNNWVNP